MTLEIIMLLSTAAVASLVSLTGLHLANRAASPTSRVHLGLWSLAVVPVSLTVCTLSLFGGSSMENALCGDCWGGSITSLALSFGMAILALALVAGLFRVILLGYTLRPRLSPAPVHLQKCADDLARRAGSRPVPVLLLSAEMPVAFTWGLVKPRLVLSSWMLDSLDPEELEAALAHELAHALGHDCRTIWVANLLRDATLFLPWTWQARRAVVTGKELLADDTAVTLTGRPLALASAIAKVWQKALPGPSFSMGAAVQLSEAGTRLEMRIERLLSRDDAVSGSGGRSEPLALPSTVFRAVPYVGWLVAVSLALLVVCARV